MYLLIGFRKSTPPQNRQLIVYYYYSRYYEGVHVTTEGVHLTTECVHLTTEGVHLTTEGVHLTSPAPGADGDYPDHPLHGSGALCFRGHEFGPSTEHISFRKVSI